LTFGELVETRHLREALFTIDGTALDAVYGFGG
jgi:hypothetical protein